MAAEVMRGKYLVQKQYCVGKKRDRKRKVRSEGKGKGRRRLVRFELAVKVFPAFSSFDQSSS